MKKLVTTALALALVVPALTVAAEEPPREDVGKAVAAAETWLKLIDEGKLSESWASAAALFKGAVTEEQWIRAAEGARKPLGSLIERKVAVTKYATSLPGAPDGEYVVIQFETTFENKAAAVETVTPMRDPDGEWRASGYYIK